MNVEYLLLTCCGVEDDGECVRLYLDSPTPEPSARRDRPVKTTLFHLLGGADAQAVRDYLARHRCWDVIRVPQNYTQERGIAAIRVAARWHSGRYSPLYLFAAARTIRDEEHRRQLSRAVRFLLGSVLENPTDDRHYTDLSLLREVIETAPVGFELCTANEASG
jgi:hypothetical protein